MIYNETVKTILERRTIREFLDKQISDEELDTILECAKWAPSGRNGQPCHLRIVQDKAMLDEINVDFKNLVGWDTPAYSRWDKNPVYQNAPTVIFMYGENDCSMDGGIMTENITLAAKSLGIGSCIIGSIGMLMNHENGRKWKERMNINGDRKFIIAVALGYPDEEGEKKPRAEGRFEKVK